VFEARSYGEPTVAAEIADPEQTWVVEDAEGALVAYAHVGPSKLPHPDRRPGDGELYQLYLLPQVQGTGLGRSCSIWRWIIWKRRAARSGWACGRAI
jgi:GNAT superfamily N-acetyltransferase